MLYTMPSVARVTTTSFSGQLAHAARSRTQPLRSRPVTVRMPRLHASGPPSRPDMRYTTQVIKMPSTGPEKAERKSVCVWYSSQVDR